MGFLDKLLGRSEEKREQVEFALGETEEFIRQVIKERTEASAKALAPVAEEILALKREVNETMEQLAEHEFSEEIKKRIPKPVLTAKPAYVKGVLDAIAEIGQPRGGFEGMEDFYRTVIAALKNIQNVQLTRGKVVVTVYQDELLKLGGVLNRIADAAGRMEEILGKSRNALKELEEASAAAAELKSKREQSVELERKILESSRAAKELEQKLREGAEKLAGIEKTQEYLEHRANEQKLEAARAELKESKSRAAGFVGALSRVLRKYRKVTQNKNEIEVVERLTRSPASIARGDCEALLRVLKRARDCIISGELFTDERDKKKALIKISEALEELPRLFERILGLEEEERRTAARLSASSILRQKLDAEREVSELGKKIAGIEAEIKSRKEQRQKLEAEAQELLLRLGKDLAAVAGKEIKIRADGN